MNWVGASLVWILSHSQFFVRRWGYLCEISCGDEIPWNSMNLQYLYGFLLWGAFFENVFSPKGWQKNLPTCWNPHMFGFDRLYNGLNHFHMQIDATNTSDAFAHVPDVSWRILNQTRKKSGLGARGRQIGFRGSAGNLADTWCRCRGLGFPVPGNLVQEPG